jgi:lipopolysaccharide export LptBFGC system permease protein LptF
MQTVTQTLLASNPVNAGTGGSSKGSTSTIRSSTSTVAKRERNAFYFLEFQDLSQWWTAILLMLSGAWLVLRFPRYRTGGLAIASRLTKVNGSATPKP